MRGTSDENDIHDEDGLKNHCSLFVIGITRYKDSKSDQEENVCAVNVIDGDRDEPPRRQVGPGVVTMQAQPVPVRAKSTVGA